MELHARILQRKEGSVNARRARRSLVALLSVSLWSASACPLTPMLEQTTARAARTVGLDVNLLRALLWHESRMCHLDEAGGIHTSKKGALGIGQLMPATAAELGVDPYNLVDNVGGAARYLRTQWDTFGDWHLALAAYNAGPGAVQDYGGVPPYEETETFVTDILTSYTTFKRGKATMQAVVSREEPSEACHSRCLPSLTPRTQRKRCKRYWSSTLPHPSSGRDLSRPSRRHLP